MNLSIVGLLQLPKGLKSLRPTCEIQTFCRCGCPATPRWGWMVLGRRDDSTAINPSICFPRSPFVCLVLENDTALLCCQFQPVDDFNLTVTAWLSASWNQETETASFHHTQSGDARYTPVTPWGERFTCCMVSQILRLASKISAWRPWRLLPRRISFGWLVGGDSELWPSSNFPDRSIHHKTYNIHVAYTLSVWQECARSTTLRVKCWSAPQIKRCVGWQGVHLSPCAVFSRFPCSFMSMWNQRSCNGFGGQEVERQAASEWFDWDSFFCLLFAACLGYRDHFW